MHKAFITGGRGFVGTNLCIELVQRGVKIVCFDNHSTCQIDYISPLGNSTMIRHVKGDIRHKEHVQEASKDCDVFFHLAASGNVIDSITHPLDNFDNNVLGTLNCLAAAKANGIDRFIFSSTGGALMGDAEPPVDEHSIPAPISPYGASKLACEGYCRAFAKSYGLHTTIFRFANVIGEYCAHKKGVINQFYAGITQDTDLTVFGDSSRDFIYVKDLVDGIILGSTARLPSNEIFHLCSGHEVTISQLAHMMISLTDDCSSRIVVRDARKGEIARTFSSPKKAEKILGFQCRFSLAQSLENTLKWLDEYSLTNTI